MSPEDRDEANLGTVLVVDDQPDVRHVAALILSRAGYDTLEASDGYEAVAEIRSRGAEIDVVLLDLMMPRMTGHEAIVEIRELAPTMPVVFFSGHDESEVSRHLGDPSAYTAFLPKPFDSERLVAAIEAALGG